MSLTQILDRLDALLPDIAGDVFLRVWGIPGYDDEHLPSSDLAGYVQPNLGAVLQSLRTGGAPAPEAIAAARRIGESRALQGVPIDAVIQSWSTAERVFRDRLLELGRDLRAGDLVDYVQRMEDLFAVLTRESVDAYRKTQDEVTTHYDRLTTDLLSRLTGEQPADPGDIRRRARAIGVEPSATYAAIVVAVRPASGGTEPRAYVRVQRHLLATIGARVSGRVLVGTLDQFTLMLVPSGGPAGGLDDQIRHALAQRSGDEAVLVGISAGVADLPAAGPICQQAREALEIGLRRRAGGALVRFADVAADVLLLRNPDISELLAGRLDPLAGRPELVETLRAYLACGLSARETARRMYVHPNTVPYRLKVIERALGVALASSAADPGLALGLRALALRGEGGRR